MRVHAEAERRWREEREELVCWRLEELRRAGYSEHAAVVLARDLDADLRLAVSLRERGCPEQTAFRILF
jgi:hypothetical protein